MKKGIQGDRYKKWIYLFLIGFLIGIFLMNAAKDFFLSGDGILNPSVINRLKYLDVDSNNLFYYVIKERAKIIVLLCLLSTTYLGLVSAYCFVLWQGFMTGMFFTAAVIRYGIKGILMLLVSMFPQQLLLVPAWILLLSWCSQVCCEIYFPYKISTAKQVSRRNCFMRKGLFFLWILLVVIIGCILECYVNPILIFELFSLF